MSVPLDALKFILGVPFFFSGGASERGMPGYQDARMYTTFPTFQD